MKGLLVNNRGKQSLSGPGRVDDVTLGEFCCKRRLQELIFDLARTLTVNCLAQKKCNVPAHLLFPQLVPVVQSYLEKKVHVQKP